MKTKSTGLSLALLLFLFSLAHAHESYDHSSSNASKSISPIKECAVVHSETWTGVFITHEGVEADAIYTVEYTMDKEFDHETISNVVIYFDILVDDRRIDRETLANVVRLDDGFSFDLESKHCRLFEQQGGPYTGECVEYSDSQRVHASYIEMTPPEDPKLIALPLGDAVDVAEIGDRLP